MSKLKIRAKLILVNLIIILVLIIGLVVLQNLFYESYYKHYVEKTLVNSIKGFEKILEVNGNVEGFIQGQLEQEDIALVYLDKDYKILNDNYGEERKFSIRTKRGEVRDIYGLYLPDVGVSIGDYVEIKGFSNTDDGKVYVKELTTEGRERFPNVIMEPKNQQIAPSSLIDISGEVVSYGGNNFKNGEHMQGMHSFISILKRGEMSEEKTIKLALTDKLLMGRQIDDYYVVGSITMESPKDMVKILNGFNSYIMVPHLILAVFIIFLFSKRITKPLLLMKESAKAISRQDFSHRVSIKTGDELEELGESLNDISDKLDNSMKELKLGYEERLEVEKSQRFFLTNISHDLKTPLTVIKGYLNAIKDGVYDKEEYIEYTIQGVDDISENLDEMLNITKLKSSSYEINKEIVDFVRVIYRAYDGLKSLAKQKEQKFNFSLVDEAFVQVDEKEMSKVIENIMVNGIKYSPQGAMINVKLASLDEEYVLTVENEGVHIPEEELENVFKEFYRVDKSRNRKVGGSGLGLVIVKVILDRHGMVYDITNSNKGVLFKIQMDKVKF